MKRLFTVALMVVFLVSAIPVFAYAARACEDYKDAELQDMDRDTLFEVYCDARDKGTLTFFDIDSRFCRNVMDKIQSVYKKKFDNEIDPFICDLKK